MARTSSFSSFGTVIDYPNVLANNYNAYDSGGLQARRAGQYYVELCVGVEVILSPKSVGLFTVIMPTPPYGEGIKRCFCLTSVCRVHRA